MEPESKLDFRLRTFRLTYLTLVCHKNYKINYITQDCHFVAFLFIRLKKCLKFSKLYDECRFSNVLRKSQYLCECIAAIRIKAID